jgi:hypothetical protein
MTDVQHRELAAGRWWELSIAEQLGNIGSEVSRAVRWTGRHPRPKRPLCVRKTDTNPWSQKRETQIPLGEVG